MKFGKYDFLGFGIMVFICFIGIVIRDDISFEDVAVRLIVFVGMIVGFALIRDGLTPDDEDEEK